MDQAMNTLCIILARAGSKGLPDKNARVVAGKPMLAWTIEHALNADALNDVVLSTDGQTLLAIGRSYGIDLIERPPELADDGATVDSAARHAVEMHEQTHSQCIDAAVILYGNIPVRPADLTDRAVTKLRDTGCDSVQSVYPVGKMHPLWMKQLGGDDNDELVMYEDNRIYRRQDLPPVYMLDGGIIAVTRDSLFNVIEGEPHAFLGEDRRAIVTQPQEVMDVDSPLDLTVAEAILKERRAGQSAA